MRQKDANGKRVADERIPWWPSRPFGYTAEVDKDTGLWWTVKRVKNQPPRFNPVRKHPAEAKHLREAYRRFNAGTTLRTIATDWNNGGVQTPRGNRWTGTAVRALLLAERNAGIRRFPVQTMQDGGKVVKEIREVEGTWPAMVSREVWAQAAGKLADPTRGTSAPRVRLHLLSGIARCGNCGAGWVDKKGVHHEPADVALGSAKSSRGQRQYHCNRCQKLSRDAVRLDALVIERVVWRLSQDDAADLLRPPVEEVDAAELREERRSLREKLAQLGRDFATADPAFTQAALAEINGRLDEIGRLLDDPGKAAIFEGVIGAKDVRKAFLGLDLGRKRTIVDTLLTVTVLPVGKGTGRVFDPGRILMPWKDDV